MVHLCSPEAHSSFGSQDSNLSAVLHSQDYASSESADGSSPLPSFLTSRPSVLTPRISSFVYNLPLLWNSDSVSKCAKLPVSDSFQLVVCNLNPLIPTLPVRLTPLATQNLLLEIQQVHQIPGIHVQAAHPRQELHLYPFPHPMM